MADPARATGVYRRLLASQLRGQAAYRASFVFELFTNMIVPVTELVAILAVFRVTRHLGGFDVTEVLLMYGLAGTAFATADLLAGNIERMRFYVRQGTLDAILVRPLSVLGQLLALDFASRRVARVAVCAVVLAVAAERADVQWTPARVALVVSTVVCGALFFCALFVGLSTVAFWWIDSGEFANGFTYGGRDFTSYPITVYRRALRALFAYGMGLAFIAYGPAVALLGRVDPAGLPGWLHWAGGPITTAVAIVIAGLMWRNGIRHYRGTGS